MNCPDCHCTREGPFTETSPSGLVTRCQHAFHAAVTAPSVRAEPVSVSPVVPDDFVRPEPNAAAKGLGAWLEKQGPGEIFVVGRCIACGDRSDITPRGIDGQWCCQDGVACAARCAALTVFDPNPPKLTPAQSGFVWCAACESPQPVSGHECAGSRDAGEALESAARWYGEASAKGPGPNLDDAKAELRKCALAFAARGGGR